MLTRHCLTLISLLFAVLLFVTPAPILAADLTGSGYLDVTSAGADPTGATDSTAAIQKAVETARDTEQVLFFPAGTYSISDTIHCLFQSKVKACRLAGSTRDPARRAVIRLMPSSPGFADPKQPKVVIHLRRADEKNADHYEQSIMGIDIVVAEGNPGAVGVRLQGAENTHIEDMTIDLSRSGHVGLWGPPASGGSTHKIRVIGGDIGVSTADARTIPGVEGKYSQNTQPTAVLSGIILENQKSFAVISQPRGALVMVGCRITRQQGGPAILIGGRSRDGLSGTFNLIDSSIEYAAYSDDNTVIAMDSRGGRSFTLENCYLRNARHILTPDAPANPSGWSDVQHMGWAQDELPKGMSETPFVNGAPVAGPLYYASGQNEVPPDDLHTRHTWGDTFPSFETPGAVDVKQAHGAKGDGATDDTAAIQAAIDAGEVVFFPTGRYVISQTLRLKKNTKLVGVYSTLSQIVTRDTPQNRFAGATSAQPVPMLQMPDVPDGDIVVAGLHIGSSQPLDQHDPTEIASYPIQWRCRALFRDCDVHPFRQTNYHPAKALDAYYKDPDYPDNGKYPSQMKYDVLPRKWPLIQATGHAEGRFYNFYLHGDHYEKPDCRFVRIEGTARPIAFYSFHCQHNQADYYFEAVNAKHVAVYGSKSEQILGIALFRNCDHVRWFGHGGIGAPAPGNPRGIDWFFRFENTPNFVFGGFSPELDANQGRFISHQAPYHNWWRGAIGDARLLVDLHEGRTVQLDKLASPILYLRGNPAWK